MDILGRHGVGDLDVTIDPEELDGLDEGAVRARYEQRLAEVRAASAPEVCSHMGSSLLLRTLLVTQELDKYLGGQVLGLAAQTPVTEVT